MMASRKFGGFFVYGEKSTAVQPYVRLVAFHGCRAVVRQRTTYFLDSCRLPVALKGYFALYPSCKREPAKSNHGGSEMFFYIKAEKHESIPEDPAADFGNCFICGGYFFKQDEDYIAIRGDYDGTSEPLGSACFGCYSLTAENLWKALDGRSSSLLYQSHELHEQVQTLQVILRRLDREGDQDAWEDARSLARAVVEERDEAQRAGKFLDQITGYDDIQAPSKRKETGNTNARIGFVYLLSSPEGYCKIGRTKRVTERLLQIGLQLPFRVELLHSIPVSDPVWAERTLHQKFAACRMNGEWFLLSDSDINWIKALTSLEQEDSL